jgi:hypothetical protein
MRYRNSDLAVDRSVGLHELPDLFGMELEHEGPMACPMIFMIMNLIQMF